MLAEIEERSGRSVQRQPISPTSVSTFIQIFDPVAIGATGLIVYLIYAYFRSTSITSPYIAAIFIAALGACIIFHWFDVYEEECIFSRRLPIQRLLSAWAVTFAILLAIAFTLKISGEFSRIWATTWFLGTAGVLASGRLLISQWTFKRVNEGRLGERTVIFGAGEDGQNFIARLIYIADPCIKVLGFIDDRKSRVPHNSQGYKLLGDSRYLIEMVRHNMVDQVLIALPWGAGDRINEIITGLAQLPVRVFLVANFLGFALPNQTLRYVAKVPMLQVLDQPLSGWSYVLKAIEDRVLAALILVFISPLMLLIALAIKLTSPGPVIFKQKRHGFNSQLIEVWKFRTMYVDATDPMGRIQATKDDPRVTALGRFLRKSSLDELPQFINVLLGDMSIVGPRPHPIQLRSCGRPLEEMVDRYLARHRVRPGITGWAQVNGWRGETDTVKKLQKRIECDLYYIDNWSIWFDFLIILKTIIVIFRDENAY